MKIAITGGNGFIGSTLVSELIKSTNHHVSIYTNRKLDYDITAPSSRYSINIVDLVNTDIYDQLVQNDVVYHLAQLNKGKSSSLLEDYSINALVTANLIEACVKTHSSPFLILASTSNINRSPKSAPASLWSLHKLFSEQYLKYYIDNCCGHGVSVRIPNVYGMPANRLRYLDSAINKMKQAALSGKIRLFENRHSLRSFVHVNDLISCFIGLLQIIDEDLPSTVYVSEGLLQSYSDVAMILSERSAMIDKQIQCEYDDKKLSDFENYDDRLCFPDLFALLSLVPSFTIRTFLLND